MNAIPKAGGNRFSGIGAGQRLGARACRAATSPTGLKARGLHGASTTLKKLYDINGAVGGPIKQDKVWFYATSRYFTNEFYLAGRFYPVDPTAVVRAERPVAARRYGGTYTYDNNGRVTWAHQRQAEDLRLVRLSVQGRSALADQIVNASPEAVAHHDLAHAAVDDEVDLHGHQPAAVRGGRGGRRQPRHDHARTRIDGRHLPVQEQLAPRCIAIVNQTPASPIARRPASTSTTGCRQPVVQRVDAATSPARTTPRSASSCSAATSGAATTTTRPAASGTRTRDGTCPTFVTIQAPAAGWQNNLNYNLGIFAQDRWTVDRLTVSGGVRLDLQNESTEPFTLGAAPLAAEPQHASSRRSRTCRTGRTSTRACRWPTTCSATARRRSRRSASRGVRAGLDRLRARRTTRRARSSRTTAARVERQPTATSLRDCDLPDCDRRQRTASGECGPWLTPNFGSAVPATRYDRVDHGRLGRAAVELGVLGRRPAGDRCRACRRRSATSAASTATSRSRTTRALTPDGLHAVFSVTVPTDPRLPDGGGRRSTGLFDQNSDPRCRATSSRTPTTSASSSSTGTASTSRSTRGCERAFLQGGVSTGKTMTDNCDIVDDVPEAARHGRPQYPAVDRLLPSSSTPFLTQYKALASYTLPCTASASAARCRACRGRRSLAANNIYNNTNRADVRRRSAGRSRSAQAERQPDRAGHVVWRPAEPDRSAVHEDRQCRPGPRGPERGPLQRVQLRRGHRSRTPVRPGLAPAADGHSAAVREVRGPLGLLT